MKAKPRIVVDEIAAQTRHATASVNATTQWVAELLVETRKVPFVAAPVSERPDTGGLSLDELVSKCNRAMAAGRRPAAGLILVEIKKRYDRLGRNVGPGELTWQAFVAKHFPGQDTAAVMRPVAHRGGTHRCTSCHVEILSRCDCGCAYVATGPGAEPAPRRAEPVHQIVHQIPQETRGRKPLGAKALTDLEKKQRYRARKKAAAAAAAEPPAPAGSIDLFDLHPSEEANAVAGKVYGFLEKFSLQLAPWFQSELSRDDREILRYALNNGVNALGQWALDLWQEEPPAQGGM